MESSENHSKIITRKNRQYEDIFKEVVIKLVK